MNEIIYEFSAGKYRVLKLDGQMPTKAYDYLMIDGKSYKPVPIYDAPNCIAIESTDSFWGKTVEFVSYLRMK